MHTQIISGYLPGSIGKVVEMHGSYYHRNRGFGIFFESKVASELGQFLCRFDPAADGFWLALDGSKPIGSISIVGKTPDAFTARLRWFIVDADHRNRGTGKSLLKEAVEFCRRAGYRRIYLTTISGLDAARRLYEKSGFRLTTEETGSVWGKPETEQVFELILK